MEDFFAAAEEKLKSGPSEPDFFALAEQKIDPRDPKVKAQDPRLAQAREWAAKRMGEEKELFGVTRDDITSRLAGGIPQVVRGQAYQKAKSAYDKGEATDEEIGIVAEFELKERREHGDSVSRTVARGLARAPGMVGEALIGGTVVKSGAKGVQALAGAGRLPAVAGQAASLLTRPTTTLAARAAQGAAVQALATPLTPTQYLEQSQQRAIKNGGHWTDPENIAPALAYGALQNAILGQVAGVSKGAPTMAGRAAVGGLAMPLEQQAADAIASVVDDQFLSEKYKVGTKYGVLGHFIEGKNGEAWKALAVQSLTGAAFSAFHGGKADPTKALAEAADALKKTGLTQEAAANRLLTVSKPVEQAVKTGADPSPMIDKLPDGKMKDYLTSLADAAKPKEPTAEPGPRGKLQELTFERDRLDLNLANAQKAMSAAVGDPKAVEAADKAFRAAKTARKDLQKPLDAARDAVNKLPAAPDAVKATPEAPADPAAQPAPKGEIEAPAKPQDAKRPLTEDELFKVPILNARGTAGWDEVSVHKTHEEAANAVGVDGAVMSRPGPKIVGNDGSLDKTARFGYGIAVPEWVAYKKAGAKPQEATKNTDLPPDIMDAISRLERRGENKGPGEGQPERRQIKGAKLAGAERITSANAKGEEIFHLGRFGEENYRMKIVDADGKDVGQVNVGIDPKNPTTLEVPIAFLHGMEFGEGAGVAPLGTQTRPIIRQLAELFPGADKVKFKVAKQSPVAARQDSPRARKAGREIVLPLRRSQEPTPAKPESGQGPIPERPPELPVTEERTPADNFAARMVAEKIAQTNTARSTAKEADFGPKAEAEAKETGRTIVQRIVDNFRELGGAIAPRLSRVSEAAGNKLSRYISARSAGMEEAPILIDKVLPEPVKNGRDMDTLAGSVLTEMRLRYMRQAFLDKGDTKAAEKVQSVVGKPMEKDGDPLANPLMTEADYQAALNNPDVQESLKRYQEHVVPVLDRDYKEALGLDHGEDIPSFTQIPGMPMNLKAWGRGDSGAGFGGAAGNLKNVKANKYAFSRRATGASEGYSTSLSEIIGHSVMSARDAGTKAAMYRQLVQDGVAKPSRPGEKPEGFDHQIPNAFGPGGLKNLAEPGQTSLWFKDEAAMKEVRKALDVDLPWKKIPLSGLFNKAVLASLGEATAHTKNLMTMMVRPGMRPVDLIKNATRVIRHDIPTRERLAELASIGAIKPKGFEASNFEETHRLNPLTWTGKFLDFVDRSVRLTADDAFKRLSLREGVKKTEGARRDFINQLGQYNRRAQNDLVQFARDTGLGPFATAGTNFNINGIRQLMGAHGLQTTSKGADLRLRMEMIGRMTAIASVVPIINYLSTGDVFGDDNTPIGAVRLGKGEDGRTKYFDLLGLTGFTRGLRETGLLALGEGIRPGAKKAGATASTIFDRAVEDVFHAAAHPFVGPTVQIGEIALTGKNGIGMRVAKQAKGNESQAVYNFLAAAIQANPVVAALLAATGVDPAARKTSTEREAMKQLGPYGVKSSGQPPGKPHKSITIPVK